MTPTRETIARAICQDIELHGRGSGYVGDDSDLSDVCIDANCDLLSAADAVLRALDAAGLVVVPTDPASEARRGLEWFERTFGVPLGDMPGRLDVERVRAMIAAAPDVVE